VISGFPDTELSPIVDYPTELSPVVESSDLTGVCPNPSLSEVARIKPRVFFPSLREIVNPRKELL